jgi:hypothetical protein
MKKMDEKTWIGESLALACGGGRSHGISRWQVDEKHDPFSLFLALGVSQLLLLLFLTQTLKTHETNQHIITCKLTHSFYANVLILSFGWEVMTRLT